MNEPGGGRGVVDETHLVRNFCRVENALSLPPRFSGERMTLTTLKMLHRWTKQNMLKMCTKNNTKLK
jgi:hypothetical protein